MAEIKQNMTVWWGHTIIGLKWQLSLFVFTCSELHQGIKLYDSASYVHG